MPRIVKLLLAVLFFWFAALPLPATNYYISFSSGSNTNNGTSESTPWKSHPYMPSTAACTTTGSKPTYSHAAGDTFTFKQGDVWPNACLPVIFVAGGTSGNPDIYTFDPTWGVAGGTDGNVGQMVGTYQFTAGGAVIGTGCNNYLDFQTNNISNVTFNGVELNGYKYSSNSCAHGVGTTDHPIEVYQSTNITLSNLYVHGWGHGSVSSDDMLIVSGYNTGGMDAGSCLIGSVFDGSADSGTSGEALYAIPCAHDNIIRNMSNGLIPNEPSLIYNNKIGPINASYDASDHSNCIETDGPYANSGTSYVYNNYCTASSEVVVILGGNDSSGPAIYYVWNNIFDIGASSAHPNIPLILMGTATAVHGWNNTISAISGGSVNACIENQGTYPVKDFENNFCISNKGFDQSGTSYPGNVVMTSSQATSAGLSASQTYAYQPQSANCGGVSNCPVGQGSNLTSSATGNLSTLSKDTTYAGTRNPNPRPSTGAWDDGAYIFSAGVLPNPPTGVSILIME